MGYAMNSMPFDDFEKVKPLAERCVRSAFGQLRAPRWVIDNDTEPLMFDVLSDFVEFRATGKIRGEGEDQYRVFHTIARRRVMLHMDRLKAGTSLAFDPEALQPTPEFDPTDPFHRCSLNDHQLDILDRAYSQLSDDQRTLLCLSLQYPDATHDEIASIFASLSQSNQRMSSECVAQHLSRSKKAFRTAYLQSWKDLDNAITHSYSRELQSALLSLPFTEHQRAVSHLHMQYVLAMHVVQSAAAFDETLLFQIQTSYIHHFHIFYNHHLSSDPELRVLMCIGLFGFSLTQALWGCNYRADDFQGHVRALLSCFVTLKRTDAILELCELLDDMHSFRQLGDSATELSHRIRMDHLM